TSLQQVRQLVRPFLLRRIKTDPAIQLDLPEKQEFKQYVTLTVEQASLYETTLTELFEELDQLNGLERRGRILSTLTRLKQICNHPLLAARESRGANLVKRSAKLMRLLEMVEELRQEGDSCLVFTQYVGMGYMMQEVLSKKLGERVQFLHGGVPKKQRDAMIEDFQNRQSRVFVLSLKAGGLGLNLTAANHVFHVDRWWNPAVENQATDRAYRIGQTKQVQVHKFVTLGTLEERIDEMLEQKQGLNELVVGGGEGWITELSTGELREVFALRREWVGV
ncbi:MAG TPA: DEAD/DEAH box helicase, partial [Bacillota bacterium]|nr:DEAD/DEAH box helicase [Bacillota bacterium]